MMWWAEGVEREGPCRMKAMHPSFAAHRISTNSLRSRQLMLGLLVRAKRVGSRPPPRAVVVAAARQLGVGTSGGREAGVFSLSSTLRRRSFASVPHVNEGDETVAKPPPSLSSPPPPPPPPTSSGGKSSSSSTPFSSSRSAWSSSKADAAAAKKADAAAAAAAAKEPAAAEAASNRRPAAGVASKLMSTYSTVQYGERREAIHLGTGVVAMQCDSSAIGVHGGAAVLATVVSSRAEPAAGDDFLPLTVEYREKAHAFGRIQRLANRREGMQLDQEVLSSRVVDRVIRPLFPQGYCKETQVVTTVHAADPDQATDLTVLAVNAASTALATSPIPWDGPVGCVRVGMIDGKLVVHPTVEEMKRSTLDLLYAGNEHRTLMIEAGGDVVSEEDMIRALQFAHFHCHHLIQAQKDVMKTAAKAKWDSPLIVPTDEMMQVAHDTGYLRAVEVFGVSKEKGSRSVAEAQLHQDIRDAVKSAFPDCHPLIPAACSEAILKKGLRDAALQEGRRCDGRGFNELRFISCDADVLPSVHGSAIFTRGETQVLCTVTLGSDEDAIPPRFHEDDRSGLTQSSPPAGAKKAFLHYDFPPYSVNEIGKVFGSNRRMVGHGALAERAILPVLPGVDEFPYTIRVTSETTQSNGSSSMASACGASMALMDAGVPIKNAVAGVSIGLLTYPPSQDNNHNHSSQPSHQLLVDILGLEDHYGDMDFKVAGTYKGITAIQLDVKLQGGVALGTLCDAIWLAAEQRKHILSIMRKRIWEPQRQLKPTAPRMEVVRYPHQQHKDLFTLENRRVVEDEYEVKLGFPEEGKVSIFGRDTEKVALAHAHVRELVSDVVEGETYTATVAEIKDFGVVLEVMRGKQGLLHASEVSHQLAGKPINQLLAVGQQIKVKCLQVDRVRGLIRVSRKALLHRDDPDDLKPQPNATGASSIFKAPVPPNTQYTHLEKRRRGKGDSRGSSNGGAAEGAGARGRSSSSSRRASSSSSSPSPTRRGSQGGSSRGRRRGGRRGDGGSSDGEWQEGAEDSNDVELAAEEAGASPPTEAVVKQE